VSTALVLVPSSDIVRAAWPHQRDHEVLRPEPSSAQVTEHEPGQGIPELSRGRAARWFLTGTSCTQAAISNQSGILGDSRVVA